MRKLTAIVALTTVGLGGCATGDYKVYADTQRAIAESQASASVARIDALAEIAKTGDTTARVAAVISLNQLQPQNNTTMLRQPDSAGDTLLKWTSVLLPSLTQFYAIGKNTEVAINNSNNARDISIDTNQTMLGFGRLSSGRDVPIVGTQDDVLLYPLPTAPATVSAP
jgi:hypothetical protein